MRLLLDTHFAVWLARGTDDLSVADIELISRPTTRLLLSTVSLWETRLKWNSFYKSGGRKGRISPDDLLNFAQRSGWAVLELSATHAVASLREPLPHKDPFDELLMVQAQAEDIRLLTRDRDLVSHPLAFVP